MLNIWVEWDEGYNLFAGHDCDIYDLELSILASEDTFANIEFSSTGILDQFVSYELIGAGDARMKFLLTP
jgi:hypothetical protein